MRARALIGMALAAACATHAAGQTAGPHSMDGQRSMDANYVVWVAALNLRAGPSLNTDVIRVLTRGEVLADLREEVEWEEGRFWRRVEAGGRKGWVADDYVLPVSLYEAFREADERGWAGDAEGMRCGLDKAINNYRPRVEDGWSDMWGLRIEDIDTEGIWRQFVSPDGTKVIVVGEWGYIEWGGGYPEYGRVGTGVPVLCFENGKGLVNHYRSMEEIIGKWSLDSRYFAYPNTTVIEFTFEMPFALLDANSWEGKIIGDIVTTADWFEYEFANGYVIWMGRELVKERPSFLEEKSYRYVLWAYDLKTGGKVRILETNLKTIDAEECGGKYGLKLYKAQMVPAGSIPAGIADSPLYKKYANKFCVSIEDVTHWME